MRAPWLAASLALGLLSLGGCQLIYPFDLDEPGPDATGRDAGSEAGREVGMADATGDGQSDGDGAADAGKPCAPFTSPCQVDKMGAGELHGCALMKDRSLWCWGSNQYGQLGTGGEGGFRSVPATVTGLPSAPIGLAAGAVHTCALLADGSAYCWGQNLHGQLGEGTTGNSPVPVPVDGGFRFSDIYAGGAITCGVTAEGAQYCWGFNQGGQLGDGTRTNRSTPVRVGGS